MGQKLILPINNCKLGVGHDSAAYPGYVAKYSNVQNAHHWGWDLKGQKTVYASGNGTVIDAGWDADFGYIAIIQYNDVDARDVYGMDTNYYRLIFRYFHMSDVKVTKGQTVTKDTVVGYIGQTGNREYTKVDHVQIEIDQDYKYPAYSPSKPNNGVAGKIKPGNADTLVIPWGVFNCKISSPDSQSFNGDSQPTWTNPDNGRTYNWYDQIEITSVPKIK